MRTKIRFFCLYFLGKAKIILVLTHLLFITNEI